MKSKIFVLFILCMILSLPLFSQEFAADKGAMWIGGTGSFTSSGGDIYIESDEKRITSFTLSPVFNYFILKNVFVGAGLAISKESQGVEKIKGFGIGPHLGFVLGNNDSKIFPYIDAGLRYYTNKFESNYIDSNINGSETFFSAGIILPVKKHIGIVLEAEYQMMNIKIKDEDYSSQGNVFSIEVGIIGLLYKPGQ